MTDHRHDDEPLDEHRSPDEDPAAAGDAFGNGRDRVAGTHPELERSSRSKTTAIALVIALAAAGVLYLTLAIQIA